MDNMQQIKAIVAGFLHKEAEAVSDDTVIDRTTIKGSIMLHRMYARISDTLGNRIQNYNKIRTFGDLLDLCNPGMHHIRKEDTEKKAKPVSKKVEAGPIAVGIDIEEVKKMPVVDNFREDNFYKENFSPKEISYCLTQPDCLQSFAGKFAAKEAIVKADNSYRDIPFCQITVENYDDGRPYFRDFAISISHTDNFAVAVAVKTVNYSNNRELK